MKNEPVVQQPKVIASGNSILIVYRFWIKTSRTSVDYGALTLQTAMMLMLTILSIVCKKTKFWGLFHFKLFDQYLHTFWV